MKAAVWRTLALIAALLLVCGCTAQQPVEKKPLYLVISNWPPSFVSYIAQERGYFDDKGVNVQIIQYPDYDAAFYAFRDNKSMDCIHIVATDLYTYHRWGVNTKMVLPLDTSRGADVLVAGGNITDISQLRGKKIAAEGFNGFSHLFVIKLLEKHNVSESEVLFTFMPSTEVPRAIANGTIDAGHVYAASYSEALSLGQKKIGDSSEVPNLIFDGIACRQRAIAERPGEVQAFVDAWFAARSFQAQNPADAASIIALDADVQGADAQGFVEGVRFYGLSDGKAAFAHGGELENALATTQGFLLERGQASASIAPSELVDKRFMENATETIGAG